MSAEVTNSLDLSGVYTAAQSASTAASNAQSTANTALSTAQIADFGMWGDGSDGNLSMSGPLVLTRDVYYNNLTTNGFAITTNGYRIHARTLTISASGSIVNDGSAASASTGGAGAPAGSLGGGGTGGTYNVNSGVGDSLINSLGGNGGDGDTISGGTTTAPTASSGNVRSFQFAMIGWTVDRNTLSWLPIRGGAGGSASSTSPTSGGGGGGGGVILIAARTIVNGGAIHANGGNGATVAGPNNGGGGGGGAIILIYHAYSGAGTITVNGGLAFGAPATSGSAGTIIQVTG